MTKVQNTNVSAATQVENKKVKKQQQKKEQQVFKGNGNKQTVQKPNDSALKQEIYKKTGFQLKDTKNRGQIINLKVNGRVRPYETVGTLTTGGRILVKERGKEVYHVVSHTPDKKPVMLKDDYARNKVFYETTSAEHKVKIGKKNYIITNSKRDRHGRMTAINSRGQEVILSHDGKELKHSYVEAEDQKDNLNDYIAQQTKGKSKAEANKIRQQIMDGNSSYSSKGVLRFKASNGEVWYYDTKRKTYVKYAEKEAQAIIKDLDKGAKEDWWLFRTGLGTDYELLKNTNAQIIDPEVLNKINKHYSTEYGKKVDKNAEYGSGKYKTAYEAFLASEIGDDEVYLFNATLVKNKAITDQSRRNEILQTNLTKISGIGIEGLGVGVNKRANRMAAADAASTKEDYQTLQDAAEDENIKNNYKPQFKGQDALQTYIYGVHDGDVQEIDDFNNALIDPKENMLDRDEIVRIKAETGVLWLKERNFKKGFEAQDNDVTKQMFALQNPNGKAVLNAKVLKQQAKTNFYGEYLMYAKPELFTDEELANKAISNLLMALDSIKSIEDAQDPTKSSLSELKHGGDVVANMMSNTGTIDASKNGVEDRIVKAYSLIRNEKVLNIVKQKMGDKFNLLQKKEQAMFKTNTFANITTITNKQVTEYSDNKGEAKLTPEQIAHNKYVVTWLKSQLADIERDKKLNNAKEGLEDDIVDAARNSNRLGTTRDSMSRKYDIVKSNMARLEAAAEGRLVDASGKPVSFEDAVKNLGEVGIQTLEQANADYQSAQAKGKFVLDMIVLAIPIPGLSAGNIVRLSGTLYKIVGTTGKMYKAIKVTEEAVKGQKIINYVVKEAKTLKKATSSAIKTVKEAEKAEKGIKIAKFAEKYPKLNKVLKLTDASATGAMHMELKTAILEGTNIATSREGFTSDRISEMNEKVKSAGKFGGMGGAIGGTTGMLAEYVSSTGAKYVVHGLGLVADVTGAAGLMTAESHGETNFWDNLRCVNPDGSFNFEQATMTAMMIYGHLHGASTVRGKSKAQVFDEITTNNDLQLRYQKGNEGSYEYFNAEALKWEPTTKEFFNERVARDGVKREAHSVKLENRELRLDNDGIWSDAESGRKFRLAKDNNGRTQLAELTKKEIYNSRQKTEVKDGMTLEDFRQELKNNDLRGNVYTKADGGRLVVVKHSFNKYELYEFDTNNKMISQKSVKGKSAIKESYPEFANVESSGTIGSTSGYLGMNNPVGNGNKSKNVETLQDNVNKKELTALRNELGIKQSKPGHSFVGETDGANTVINEMKGNETVNSYIVLRDAEGKAHIEYKVSYKNGKATDVEFYNADGSIKELPAETKQAALEELNKPAETNPVSHSERSEESQAKAEPKFSESNINFSRTHEGFSQIEGNVKDVPDLRNADSFRNSKDGVGVVYLPKENATAIVVKISGRVNDNYTIMIDGKIPEEQCRALVKSLKESGNNRFDRQQVADILNKQYEMAETDPTRHSERSEESQTPKTEEKTPVSNDKKTVVEESKPLSTEVPKATPEQVAQVMDRLTVFSSEQGARLAFVGKHSSECANVAKKELIYTVDNGKSVKYFPDKDISLIDVSAITKESSGRIGTFRITVKGRVSEADAKALMEHLFDKGVIKRDADGRLLTKSVLINGNNEKLGEAISEFLANKKLNSQNPIGHSERVSGTEQPVKHTENEAIQPKIGAESNQPATENSVTKESLKKDIVNIKTRKDLEEYVAKLKEASNKGIISNEECRGLAFRANDRVKANESKQPNIETNAQATESNRPSLNVNDKRIQETMTIEDAKSLAKKYDNVEVVEHENGNYELKVTYKDADGNIKTTIESEHQNGKVAKEIIKETATGIQEDVYNNDGKVVSSTIKDVDGNVIRTNESEYQNGKKVKTVRTEYKDGKVVETAEYEYNDGKVVKEKITMKTDSVEFEYDNDGKVVKETIKDVNGNITRISKYNEVGVKTKETRTLYKEGKIVKTREIEKNDSGLTTKEIQKDADGKITEITETEYEDLKPTKEINKDADGKVTKIYDHKLQRELTAEEIKEYISNKDNNTQATEKLATENSVIASEGEAPKFEEVETNEGLQLRHKVGDENSYEFFNPETLKWESTTKQFFDERVARDGVKTNTVEKTSAEPPTGESATGNKPEEAAQIYNEEMNNVEQTSTAQVKNLEKYDIMFQSKEGKELLDKAKKGPNFGKTAEERVPSDKIVKDADGNIQSIEIDGVTYTRNEQGKYVNGDSEIRIYELNEDKVYDGSIIDKEIIIDKENNKILEIKSDEMTIRYDSNGQPESVSGLGNTIYLSTGNSSQDFGSVTVDPVGRVIKNEVSINIEGRRYEPYFSEGNRYSDWNKDTNGQAITYELREKTRSDLSKQIEDAQLENRGLRTTKKGRQKAYDDLRNQIEDAYNNNKISREDADNLHTKLNKKAEANGLETQETPTMKAEREALAEWNEEVDTLKDNLMSEIEKVDSQTTHDQMVEKIGETCKNGKIDMKRANELYDALETKAKSLDGVETLSQKKAKIEKQVREIETAQRIEAAEAKSRHHAELLDEYLAESGENLPSEIGTKEYYDEALSTIDRGVKNGSIEPQKAEVLRTQLKEQLAKLESESNQPVTEPPATEPPVTEPPVTEPPATEQQTTEKPVIEDKYPNVPKIEEVETNEGLQFRHKVGDENSYEFFEPGALKWEPTTKEFFENMTSRDGVKSKATYQNIKKADGSTVQRFIDANGKKVKQINRNKDGKITGSDEYVYDVDGKRSKKISKNKDGKVSISTEYKYNEVGKESERIIKDGKGNVIYSEEYKYDKSGNQIEFINKDENGKITNSTEYKYNEFGKKSEIINKDKDGNPVDSTVFKYDANGKKSLEYKKDSKGEIVSSEEYKYNADGKLSKTITHDKDGNITIIYDNEQGRLLSPEETNNYIKESLKNDIKNIKTQDDVQEYIAELGEALEKKIITDEEYNALVEKAGDKRKAEEAARIHADEVAEANNGERRPVTPETEEQPVIESESESESAPVNTETPTPAKPSMFDRLFHRNKVKLEKEVASGEGTIGDYKFNTVKDENGYVRTITNNTGEITGKEYFNAKGKKFKTEEYYSDGKIVTEGNVKTEYNADGTINKIDYPHNKNVEFTYDKNGNFIDADFCEWHNRFKNYAIKRRTNYKYNSDKGHFELLDKNDKVVTDKNGKPVGTATFDPETRHWVEEGQYSSDLAPKTTNISRGNTGFRARISKATKNIIDKFRSNKPKNGDGTTIPKKFRGRDDVTYNSELKEYTEEISEDGDYIKRVYDSKGTLLRESIDKKETVFYNKDGVDIAVEEVISTGFQRTEFSKDYDLEIQRDLNGNYKKATIKYHDGHEPKENGTKITSKEYSYEDGKFVSKKDENVVETLEYDAGKHSWTIKNAKGKTIETQENRIESSHKVRNFVAGTTLAGVAIGLLGRGIYELSNKDDEDNVGTIAEDGTLTLDGKSYPKNADGTYTIDGKKYKVEDGKLVEVVDTPDDDGKTTKVTLGDQEGTIDKDTGTIKIGDTEYPKNPDDTYTINGKTYKLEGNKLVEVVDTPDDNGGGTAPETPDDNGGGTAPETPDVTGTIGDKEYIIKDGKVSVDGEELTPDENGHYKIGDDKYKIEDGKLVKVEPEEPAKTDTGTDAAQSDDSQTGGGNTGDSSSGATGSQAGGRTGGSTSRTTGSQAGGRTGGSTSGVTGTTHNDTSRPVTTRHSEQSEDSRANSVRHSERSEESRHTGNTPVTGVTEPTEAQKQVANALQNEISGISTEADARAFFEKLKSALENGQITPRQGDELMNLLQIHAETLNEAIKIQNEQDAIPEPEFGLGEVPTQQEPQHKEKREITPPERMALTEKISKAKTRKEIAEIQQEMRQYKVFPGRKNLRRAYKAKLRAITHDGEQAKKYNEKFNKRMEKIENSNVYKNDKDQINREIFQEMKYFDDIIKRPKNFDDGTFNA